MPPHGIGTEVTEEIKQQVLSPLFTLLLPWYTWHRELGSAVSKMAEPTNGKRPGPRIIVWMRDISYAHFFDYVRKKKLSF